MAMLTKEQFRAQFNQRTVFENEDGTPFEPMFSEVIQGYEIYRALQLLALKDGDTFYVCS